MNTSFLSSPYFKAGGMYVLVNEVEFIFASPSAVLKYSYDLFSSVTWIVVHAVDFFWMKFLYKISYFMLLLNVTP